MVFTICNVRIPTARRETWAKALAKSCCARKPKIHGTCSILRVVQYMQYTTAAERRETLPLKKVEGRA